MRLNFGCGKDIKRGWVNVDIQKGEGIDKSFDFNKFPYPFKDNTFDYILVDNVLEHLDDPRKVVEELWRISKPDAIIEVKVPYYHSAGAYNDIGHKHFFNKRTLEILFCPERSYAVTYQRKFKIIELKLLPSKRTIDVDDFSLVG